MVAAARPGGHPPRIFGGVPVSACHDVVPCSRRRTCFCVGCGQPQAFRWLLRCSIRRTRFCVVGPVPFCGYLSGMREQTSAAIDRIKCEEKSRRTRFCVQEGLWKGHIRRRAYLFLRTSRHSARVGPAGRPYPFLRRPRAALDFVRRSRAYPILRGARGRVVSGMACRARPGVLAVGRIGGREQERGAWPAIGAGGSGAGRGVMKVALVAPPVALPASENKKPRHRAPPSGGVLCCSARTGRAGQSTLTAG